MATVARFTSVDEGFPTVEERSGSVLPDVSTVVTRPPTVVMTSGSAFPAISATVGGGRPP
jgi:hypothetical protein